SGARRRGRRHRAGESVSPAPPSLPPAAAGRIGLAARPPRRAARRRPTTSSARGSRDTQGSLSTSSDIEQSAPSLLKALALSGGGERRRAAKGPGAHV